MILDEHIWQIITKSESDEVPAWIRKMQLPEANALMKEQKISCESNIVDLSYICFLEQQIALGVRGPEWTKIMQRRLAALKTHVGKPVTTVMIAKDNLTITIRIDPKLQRILHVEEI